MTNEELREDLLADPDTEELAVEQGMTVKEYIDAALAFVDAPEAGFAGVVDGPDREDAPEDAAEQSAFVTAPPAAPGGAAPGEGIDSDAPTFRPRAGVVRG